MKLDGPTIRRVAVEADADPRTIRKLLRGEQVRPLATRRITVAMARLGLLGALPEGAPVDLDAVREAREVTR